MVDQLPASKRRGFRTVDIVDRNALSQDEGRRAFGDLYHRAMRISWPMFFAGSATVFFILNSCFALLYVCGENPIANTRPGSLLDLLFFSVETLATVGFGDMHPQTIYAHVIATVEIFTGMRFAGRPLIGRRRARCAPPRAMHEPVPSPRTREKSATPTFLNISISLRRTGCRLRLVDR
jgi:hypothetical protein